MILNLNLNLNLKQICSNNNVEDEDEEPPPPYTPQINLPPNQADLGFYNIWRKK